jgi:hypothetical protein
MGDRYGLEFKLVHDRAEPLIEFYDMRYPHTQFGQFVSRYNMDTLINSYNAGLCLHGGEMTWTLTQKSFAAVRKWINDLIVEEELT